MNCLTNLSDQQLVCHAIDGNTDAVSTLVYRHKDKLYTSIYLLVKDKYLAEDFFQDTFFKIIDTLKSGKYKEEGKFLPWAIRIAHNLCIDHFRKTKLTPVIKTSDNKDIFSIINFSEAGADERIMQNETGDKVTKMVELLPEDQREVIVMRHYANMSFKEIASLTNCSINTALGRMRYGLINLRKMIDERQIAL
jgi:RNA polymerase sigma factor (sigma-70 family)